MVSFWVGTMELEAVLLKTVKERGWWQADEPVVIAVSTGLDSMVLLTLIERLPVEWRPKITVAHINHQLRRQSAQEQLFLKRYCKAHQLTLKTTDWNVADHPNHGVEKAARDFRYMFLAQTMQETNAKVVMTAHHSDDQAETVLMKLIRGGDLSQLTGMASDRPFGQGRLIRPLLTISKGRLRQYATEQSLRWFEDETNQELTTLRNQLRNQMIPDLMGVNPQFTQHLLNYRKQLADSLELAEVATKQAYQAVFNGDVGHVDVWRQLPKPARVAVIKHHLINHQMVVNQNQVFEIAHLLQNQKHAQGEIDLTSDWQLVKRYQTFFLKHRLDGVERNQSSNVNVVVSRRWALVDEAVCIRLVSTTDLATPKDQVMTVNLSTEELPLRVTRAQKTDALALKNGGHKSLRRLWIDRQVPLENRAKTLVVKTALGEVLWVVGLQRAWRPPRNDQPQFQIQLRDESTRGEVNG